MDKKTMLKNMNERQLEHPRFNKLLVENKTDLEKLKSVLDEIGADYFFCPAGGNPNYFDRIQIHYESEMIDLAFHEDGSFRKGAS